MGKAEGLPPAWCQALERAAGVRGGRGQKRRLETGREPQVICHVTLSLIWQFAFARPARQSDYFCL